VSRDSLSEIAQLKLVDAGSGLVAWQRVRTILLPDPRQVEGMVADRELGWLYLAQEKVGLWKFPAEPSRARDGGSLLQRVKPLGAVLAADVEGLCIYYGTNGTGYLLASSQGDNTFAVFARGGTNNYLSSFVVGKNSGLGIDQVTTCDGSDVMPLALPGFPNGVLAVHDGENDGLVSVKNTNFKLVPWGDVAASFVTPLQISPSAFQPRLPVNRLPARFDAVTHVGGELRVTLSGPTGATLAVQSTADFLTWNMMTNIVMTAPVISFTNHPSAPHQFYRFIP
jgi:myo-inositol-hexaphosphate 3-phosphohydrolase